MAAVLQSCTVQPGAWKNDQINSSKRDELHAINEVVFKDLKAKDLVNLKLYMSKDLIDDKSTEKTADVVGNHLTDGDFTLLDEYYIVNGKKVDDTLTVSGAGENAYNIRYPGVTKETYIAFYIPKKGENKSLVTTVYGKYSYGWKLSDMEVSPYIVNGKTAPQLYKLAKEEYNKKYLVNAANNLALAASCLKPSAIWKYPDESDISDLYGKVLNEATAKYRYPLTLTELPARPMVLSLYSKTTDAGTYPLIMYMTHININDTNAVKAENIQVKKALAKTMPGLDKGTNVYYDAFNKYPRSDESVDRFEMVDKH